ncbi:hypothetical protein U0070_021174 [Myodes glareolus]|uniref:Uncharacterized protein n=1 Tax=Myodes glareolus TaxID=447135 RepID=A0AAW0ILZ9_MYOGA
MNKGSTNSYQAETNEGLKHRKLRGTFHIHDTTIHRVLGFLKQIAQVNHTWLPIKSDVGAALQSLGLADS